MKVAFATQDLNQVNAHFGWAKNILIYELSETECQMIRHVRFEGALEEDGDEDKLMPKIEAVRDCALLYVSAIGGSAAARVIAHKIHPVKVAEDEKIQRVLEKLQQVLRGTPPPWLRKALLKGRDTALSFDE